MQKRRSARIIKRLEVKFVAAGISYTGITSNISAHGIFIRTKKGLAPGTTLEIELRLPEGELIKLSGIVKRTVKTQLHDIKNGMGVELRHIPPKYTELINSIQ